MAQAVQSLFPGTQVTIGPTIENGFYYDFKRDQSFLPEELEQIEKRMQELVKANLRATREEMPRAQAIELFRKMGESYKVEIIEGIARIPSRSTVRATGSISTRAHVPSTGAIKAFKLTSIAGAYWRGDEKNEMLQRIYGTSWPTKEALKDIFAC